MCETCVKSQRLFHAVFALFKTETCKKINFLFFVKEMWKTCCKYLVNQYSLKTLQVMCVCAFGGLS